MPQFFTGGFVQGNDPCARLFAADVDKETVAFEQWRSCDAEEPLARLVVLGEGAVPHFCAVCEVQAMELTGGAERVNAVVRNERRGSRAVPFAVVVVIRRGVGEFPVRFARRGIEAFDDFVVAGAIEDNEPVSRNHGSTVALADRLLPQNRGPGRRPTPLQTCLGGSAIAIRAEELRPVRGDKRGQQCYDDKSGTP